MNEPNETTEDIFAEASERVLSGQSIESALKQLPNIRADLEPMLRTTRAVRDLPAPELPPDLLARVQQRAQAAAASAPNSYRMASTKPASASTGSHPASRLGRTLSRLLAPI